MLNKKGDMAWPLYLSPALTTLLITLIIFGIFFFIVGIEQNPDLRISAEAYQDNSKLLTILETETNTQNLTIAELISLANEDEKYKTDLATELNNILNKLPLEESDPNIVDAYIITTEEIRKSISGSSWNLDITIDGEQFLKLGDKIVMSDIYFEQNVLIPLENKQLADVDLYLECRSCSEEITNAIA